MELISKIGGTILVVGMILAVWKSETYPAKSLQKSRDSHEIENTEQTEREGRVMNSWCESCARKGCCYTMEIRPRCYVATTNTASGTPESYLAKSLRYSRDNHEIAKTENSSEKPNNCEAEPRKEQNFCGKCRYLYRDFKYGLSCYRLMDNEPCKYEERKTEPTISKMEQVDEPQIQLTARCLNCNNAKACKEKHWEGCVYEPKYEKTCETCKYWKYIAHEWQCETTKCQGYTPKTEQTEREGE